MKKQWTCVVTITGFALVMALFNRQPRRYRGRRERGFCLFHGGRKRIQRLLIWERANRCGMAVNQYGCQLVTR